MTIPKKILVAYDGKGGRCTTGRVVARRGCAIRVSFIPWAESERGEICEWFMPSIAKIGSGYYRFYGKFVKPDGWSLQKDALGLPGDWYSILPHTKELAMRSGIADP